MSKVQNFYNKYIESNLVWFLPLLGMTGFGSYCYQSLYNHFGDYYIILLILSALAISVLIKMLMEKSDEKKITNEYDKDIDKQIDELGMQIIQNQKNTGIVTTKTQQIEWLSVRRKKTEIIEQYIKKLNPKISNISEDNIDNFEKLFNRFFYTQIPIKIANIIIFKAMTNIDKISKETVLFLVTLDEKNLEILKKQFMYVDIENDKENNFHGCIPSYQNNADSNDNIETYFCNNGMNNIACKDIIKFTGSIWIVSNGIEGRTSEFDLKVDLWEVNNTKYYPKSVKFDNLETTEDDFLITYKNKDKAIELLKQKKFPIFIIGKKIICITNQKPSFEHKLHFSYFRQLTEVGVEVYNLLKDEIEPMPDDYIQKVFEYHKAEYPQLNLELQSYDHP